MILKATSPFNLSKITDAEAMMAGVLCIFLTPLWTGQTGHHDSPYTVIWAWEMPNHYQPFKRKYKEAVTMQFYI